MTTKFAILDGSNVVTNVIVAESLEDAQSVANGTVIEVTEETRNPFIGELFTGVVFRHAPIYPSWSWSDEEGDYLPPTPRPNDDGAYIWDEDEQVWVEIPVLREPV
jgi:hypothetical protein